jgi:hypothetical protein
LSEAFLSYLTGKVGRRDVHRLDRVGNGISETSSARVLPTRLGLRNTIRGVLSRLHGVSVRDQRMPGLRKADG